MYRRTDAHLGRGASGLRVDGEAGVVSGGGRDRPCGGRGGFAVRPLVGGVLFRSLRGLRGRLCRRAVTGERVGGRLGAREHSGQALDWYTDSDSDGRVCES